MVALVVATSVACDAQIAGPTYASVSVNNNNFAPGNVTITAGDSVFWIWSGSPHDVLFNAAPGVPADCAIDAGICIRKFPTAGTFSYYCHFHLPDMVGTVTVHQP